MDQDRQTLRGHKWEYRLGHMIDSRICSNHQQPVETKAEIQGSFQIHAFGFGIQ